MSKSEQIVKLILQRIEDGDLAPGDRLPTHRDMAWFNECSVGTITRAYAELERRGVTYGQVGRGTYIFGTDEDKDEIGRGAFMPTDSHVLSEPGITIDLSLNSFYHPKLGKRYQAVFERMALHAPQSGYRGYFDARGRPNDQHFAAQWLEPLIGPVVEKQIVITQGAQSGLYLSMATLTSPGDSIATEAFGYPGIRAAAQELGLRIAAIEMDDEGVVPAAFEAAAKRGKIKLLVTVPTNHNPTGTTVPLARRLEIVKIARANNILIVEDGVYGPLQIKEYPTYYEICPEISLYLTSFSKVFSPGLRVGYMVVPEAYMARFTTRMTAINWMTSPITLDAVSFLLDGKVMQKHQGELQQENEIRFNMALEKLKPWMSKPQIETRSPLSQVWLRLPPYLAISDAIEQARREGISLIGGDRFAMNRQQDDHFVRICLMGVQNSAELAQGLDALSDILSGANVQAMIS